MSLHQSGEAAPPAHFVDAPECELWRYLGRQLKTMKVSRILRVAAYATGGIIGLVVVLAVFSLWIASRTPTRFAASKNDLPTYVTGRWDWTSRAQPCTDSAHSIRFGPDLRTMEIRQEGKAGVGGDSEPTVYDVLQLTPSRIRGAIRGETRKTAAGQPVVWDLIMSSVNEYQWQRSDWPSYQYTLSIIRCRPKASGGGPVPAPT